MKRGVERVVLAILALAWCTQAQAVWAPFTVPGHFAAHADDPDSGTGTILGTTSQFELAPLFAVEGDSGTGTILGTTSQFEQAPLSAVDPRLDATSTASRISEPSTIILLLAGLFGAAALRRFLNRPHGRKNQMPALQKHYRHILILLIGISLLLASTLVDTDAGRALLVHCDPQIVQTFILDMGLACIIAVIIMKSIDQPTREEFNSMITARITDFRTSADEKLALIQESVFKATLRRNVPPAIIEEVEEVI